MRPFIPTLSSLTAVMAYSASNITIQKGIFGVVVDSDSKNLLPKVRVEVVPSVQYTQYTDSKGRFAFYLPNGTYTLKSLVTGYRDQETVVKVLMGPSTGEVMIQMASSSWVLGMSPMLTVAISICIMLFLAIFIYIAIRLKKSGHMQFDEMGLRQMPSGDYYDDDDSEDEEDVVVMDRNSFPMKTHLPYDLSQGRHEYHNDLSSDEEEETSLFEKPLISNGHQ